MDLYDAGREAEFLVELEPYYERMGFSRDQLEQGAKAYSWGYNRRPIIRALHAGCRNAHEISDWIDQHNSQPEYLV
jgi:hypothetical protein